MNRQWFILDGTQQKGPFTEDAITEMVRKGILNDRTALWTEGMANWTALRDTPFSAVGFQQHQQPGRTEAPTNQAKFTRIGLIVGCVLGYPLSYYFQSGALQAKLSLGGYIEHFSDVIGDKNLLSAVIAGFIVAIGVCGVAGYVIGRNLDQKK